MKHFNLRFIVVDPVAAMEPAVSLYLATFEQLFGF